MNSNQPLCSIIIRAYNEEKHLGRLLDGIQQQTIEDREIILVDSGSTDNTLEIAGRYPVKIVPNDSSEFTFGRSLNRGINAASGRYMVVADLLYPAGVLGKQRGAETNHYSEHQWFRRYFPDISQPDQGQPYTHNANAAVRKSLWSQHPYNEKITGLEDLAWSSWAKEQGYSIAYVAESD